MKIYSIADNIISPLGFTTNENFSALRKAQSGVCSISDSSLFPEEFFGAYIGEDKVNKHFDVEDQQQYTVLEKMLILSVKSILQTVPGIDKQRMLLILSTTKGNIDLLSKKNKNIEQERVELGCLANTVNKYFSLPHQPVVISNACISGVSAIIVAKKMITMGLYDHVLVCGGDILSEFTISGFQCLKAISDQPCRPYDAERKGINLGEACGTMLLSKDKGLNSQKDAFSIIQGTGQSNDANHISGPSRTGKGLKIAIEKALKSSGLNKDAIGYINGHGTATVFNDEMEAIAFHDLGMQDIPLNSLKGYFGHTLGAAGLIESIMAIRQLNQNLLIKSLGYENSGVSQSIHVLKQNYSTTALQFAMKTVSGFGGCNAAIIFEKA